MPTKVEVIDVLLLAHVLEAAHLSFKHTMKEEEISRWCIIENSASIWNPAKWIRRSEI
jgi:hypothetical protein